MMERKSIKTHAPNLGEGPELKNDRRLFTGSVRRIANAAADFSDAQKDKRRIAQNGTVARSVYAAAHGFAANLKSGVDNSVIHFLFNYNPVL